ncbi:hypothetical protein [Streptomyces sp. NPDC086147]|uniref:hypothetical protein n=1 Tax=Streptomyces sp. NPDC086147 TaxID=3155295 RepID=UPI00345074C3
MPQESRQTAVGVVGCPHLDPAELRTFLLLVGVALSPITRTDALHHLPAGHLTKSHWFATEWASRLMAYFASLTPGTPPGASTHCAPPRSAAPPSSRVPGSPPSRLRESRDA